MMMFRYAMPMVIAMLLSVTSIGLAQQHEVTGVVTDATTGVTIPGVNVVIQGTEQGTVTNTDGIFNISVPSSDAILVFTFIGYQRIEIPVDGRTEINVELTREIFEADALVVIGYGQQRRSDLTGSISSVSAQDFNTGPVLSADQLIQGRAAGVNIVQTSGQPGGGSAVSIRGLGSLSAGTAPLYVIDGLPIDNSVVIGGTGDGVPSTRSPRNPLSSINPQDIESIEILKDASATAIYGARGANGVILITTKDGGTGDLQVNYSGSWSVQNSANRLDLLNAEEYMNFINDVIDAGAADGRQELKVTEIQNGGTDWQDAIQRRNAMMQEHNLVFLGGTDQTSYRVSLNYLDQDGIAISSAFQRYGARVNINSQVGENFNIGLNLNTSYSKDDLVPYGFGTNEGSGVFYAATYFDPTFVIYDESGNFQTHPFETLINNPVALAKGIESISNSYRTFGSIFGKYEILSGLAATFRLGGDVNSEQKNVYVDRRTNQGNAAGGIATKLEGRRSNYLFESLLEYNQNFSNHRMDIIGGATFQRFENNSFSSSARGFPSDATKANNMNLADPQSFLTSSNSANNSLLSFLARTNYALADKYLFTIAFRADGSSRFGDQNKFGYFPSFAFAWRIDNEEFFSGIREVVNTLKPRISWGITGNQEIGNYNSLVTFGAGGPTFMNQQPVSTIDPNRMPNQDLKWERTEQINIGIDFALHEDRISGSIDWFNKETSDMLLNMPVPSSTGFSNRFTNVGTMSNKGFELSLITHNIARQNFTWRTSLNLSRVRNKVTDLGGLDQIITGGVGFTGNMFLIQEGLPANSFYGYEIIGVWQEDDDFSQISNDAIIPGNLKYRDVNNDGVIDSEDRVVLGDSYPDLQFSFGNNFQYKNLQLNVFFEGVLGFEMLNNNLVDTYFPVSIRRNRYSEPVLNRWIPENPSNKYPSFVAPFTQGNRQVNSYTVEDASYLKLQTVSIVYNFPLDLTRAFRNIAVNLTGQNLYTFTNYSGIDPAINPAGTTYSRIDFNAYPSTRTFTIGLNIEF